MMRRIVGLVLGVAIAAIAGTVQRHVLVVGANQGGGNRALLRYAVTDARAFAKVMTELGGLHASPVLLEQPSPEQLDAAFERMRRELGHPLSAGDRREVVFYYSGHADEKGLQLGGRLYDYQTLRRKVDGLPAEVRIAVLDACESGAITRLKGGQRREAFLVDASNGMTGTAFLTSSSEDEASQESDRLRGSFFTTAMVSGLRGAADQTGDGKITLGEAYQFAFQQTLQGTQGTKGGVQHPARDLRMSGTGDVVMTDVRRLSSGIILGEELDGRFLVRDGQGNLVAELVKQAGAPIELGLPVGTYEIRREKTASWLLSNVKLDNGVRRDLRLSEFTSLQQERTNSRGDPEALEQEVFDSLRHAPWDLQFNMMFNVSKQSVHGMQLAILTNDARSEILGHQFSVGANLARKRMDGFQFTSFANVALEPIRQGQISSAVNWAANVEGVQFSSGANFADSLVGVQAGVFNSTTGTLQGVQVGVVNLMLQGGTGLQGGIVNYASSTSFQGGIVNIAGHTKQGQIGIVNISSRNDANSYGLLNFVGNGTISGAFSIAEAGMSCMTFQSGTRRFATQFHGCRENWQRWTPKPEELGMSGIGVVTRFFGEQPLQLDLAMDTYTIMRNQDEARVEKHGWDWSNVNQLWKVSLLPSARLWHGIGIFAGPTANLLFAPSGGSMLLDPGKNWRWDGDREDRLAWWPGLSAGIRIGRF